MSHICKVEIANFKVGTPGHSPKETRRNVGRLYHKQKPKAIMPSLMAAERGYYELQIRVGKKCHRCKYFSQRTKTCDYCNIMRQSRLYTNGVRLDPRLCNKFVAGRRDYDPRLWNWGKDESND